MVWIGCIHCEKFRRHFVARPSALIAPVRPDLHRVSCSNEMFPKAPKHYETLQNMSLGCNGMDRVLCCEKFQSEFVARTFALIALVRSDLIFVSCSNEMAPNALEHYKTHQNMSLGSNGMDQVSSLRKIPTRFCCTNICINCTSSARFATSFTQ